MTPEQDKRAAQRIREAVAPLARPEGGWTPEKIEAVAEVAQRVLAEDFPSDTPLIQVAEHFGSLYINYHASPEAKKAREEHQRELAREAEERRRQALLEMDLAEAARREEIRLGMHRRSAYWSATGLSHRVRSAMVWNDIENREQLEALTQEARQDLLKIPNFGWTSYLELAAFMGWPVTKASTRAERYADHLRKLGWTVEPPRSEA